MALPRVPRPATGAFADWVAGGFLEPTVVNGQAGLRIATPVVVTCTGEVASRILKVTPVKTEGGGLLGCRPVQAGMTRRLVIEEVVAVKNISVTPWKTFAYDDKEFSAALRELVYTKGLIPFQFHTHPVAGKDASQRHIEYYWQMGSSRSDQALACPVWEFGVHAFALPQVILIRDALSDSGFFMGVYGGDVAPVDFGHSMAASGAELMTSWVGSVVDWFRDPNANKKAKDWATLGLIALGIIGLAKPKAILLVLGTAAVGMARTIPLAESQTGKPMPHFGMASAASGIQILLPRLLAAPVGPGKALPRPTQSAKSPRPRVTKPRTSSLRLERGRTTGR